MTLARQNPRPGASDLGRGTLSSRWTFSGHLRRKCKLTQTSTRSRPGAEEHEGRGGRLQILGANEGQG